MADALLAAAMLAVTLVGSIGEALAPVNAFGQTVTSGGHPAVRGAWWAAFLVVAAAALALAWRRRRPVAILTFTVTCVAAYSLLGYVNGTAVLDVMVALYTVATILPGRGAWLAGALTVAALMVSTAVDNPFGPAGGAFFLIPAEAAASVSLGVAVGSRRAYLRAVEDRAEQAERTREEEAARRVDAERLRIARELHDVVAHTLSMINVQAGAAAHVAHAQPERAAEALEAIRVASKEGLHEMRAILNVLRQADDADGTRPAPGLGLLDELVAAATRAGLSTRVDVEGSPRRLPPSIDLAAYRIVQESLTNALRHAGAAEATVHVAWHEDGLVIEVRDTGRGPLPGTGRGHGLEGMRERATATGGAFSAGAGEDGGFRVRAELRTGAVVTR